MDLCFCINILKFTCQIQGCCILYLESVLFEWIVFVLCCPHLGERWALIWSNFKSESWQHDVFSGQEMTLFTQCGSLPSERSSKLKTRGTLQTGLCSEWTALLNSLNLFFLCHSQTLHNTTIASLWQTGKRKSARNWALCESMTVI